MSGVRAQQASGDRVEVGQGVTARLALQTPLSSKLNEVGDSVRAVLYDDLLIDGQIVLERGTEFLGRITHVKPASRGMKQAEMAINFDRVKTSYGLEEVATMITAIDDYGSDRKLKGDGEGVVRGGRNGHGTVDNVYRGGTLGSLGAAAVILIGRSGGAATAGGVGIAGGMLGGLLMTKGAEIRLDPGTILRVQFERSITLPVIQKTVSHSPNQ
jgi:hypothetical protein